ncbi:Peptidase S8 subtilisin-related protein [Dioscorea alata]|uniref:Peptidase S8 subtilisin-related protein n=1 Tax=Dioscorea alata TaxID=55571 RepID=A0ACB7W2Q7_DIOAL|nr:Peptidase S8 subtilisin-related protein [Dioscorea alata]
MIPGGLPAPQVCDFSSRGPSLMNGGILKPDVIAPGEEILGASPDLRPLYNNYFMYESGTSMATPHVLGVMALIKKKYPTWSPATIQLAIITSADEVDLSGKPILDLKDSNPADIFARGAGHLNPKKAMYPGLVYDRNFSDYIGYMCGLGLDSATMQIYNDRKVDCTKEKKIKSSQLNYPSILVTLSSSSPSETVIRTVTNVGTVNAAYTAKIVHPTNTTVRLSTNVLQFSTQQWQASFNITITSIKPTSSNKGKVSAGKLQWVSSGNTVVVRSPIVVVFD